MITVGQAQKIIAKNIPILQREVVPLAEALGCILAEDIRAPLALPIFDNSAMDGYALRSNDTQLASTKNSTVLKIKGVIKAGDPPKFSVRPNETYRIMTGASIPRKADTVLPKEQAIVEKNCLVIHHPIGKGRHIRYRAEELQKGDIVVRKFSLIQPAALGILASLGKSRVLVFKKPKVSLITTGSELVAVGQPLPKGKIYDSNTWMIAASLRELGLIPALTKRVRDHPLTLKKVIRQALAQTDVVILMGGVSVGDYDYVRDILAQLEVRSLFWKVRQKPGKPIYFGRKGKKLIFGLPGNPASVFTCFYEYVFPALRQRMGFKEPYLIKVRLAVKTGIQPDPTKILFLKGKIGSNHREKEVNVLAHQGSHMISSLSLADCLVVIPPGGREIRAGTKVEVHHLP